MKIRLIYGLLFGLVGALQSCEDALPVFSATECEIRFDSSAVAVTKTFAYDGPGTEKDTLYITVQAIGFVKDYDRPFQIRQTATKEEEELTDAVVGVHFLSFEDENFSMPAGESHIKIPIVVLNDKSLSEQRFTLRLELLPNEHFNTNIKDENYAGKVVNNMNRDIVLTNLLSEPSNWLKSHWGLYGPVKHQFMIDVTGKKWNEAFCEETRASYTYMLFLQGLLKRELQAENERRINEGLDVLREKAKPGEPEGIKVDFAPVYK